MTASHLVNYMEAEMKTSATKSKSGGKPRAGVIMTMDPSPDAEDRISRIATAAYYRAEARGFTPGNELGDWLEAEATYEEVKEH